MATAAQSPDLALWQAHFDFLLPSKEFLRPDEVATALGCDTRTVLRLFDDAKLLGHEFNAGADKRQHRRARRAGVILMLAKTANYAPADLRQRLLEVLASLPQADKAALYHALGRMLLQ